MSRDLAYLMDILDAAERALSYLVDETRQEFLTDVEKQDSVIRRLEILGEAAGRISPAVRQSYPNLPWKQMVAMRNFVIHQYDGVDLDIVWDTVQQDLPGLISELKAIISSQQ